MKLSVYLPLIQIKRGVDDEFEKKRSKAIIG